LNEVSLKVTEKTKYFFYSSTRSKVLDHIDKNLSKMSPSLGNF
jgi:hypothetical protein